MEENFLKNQIKKGDPDYKYDLRVNFDNEKKEAAGWDNSDDENFWDE